MLFCLSWGCCKKSLKNLQFYIPDSNWQEVKRKFVIKLIIFTCIYMCDISLKNMLQCVYVCVWGNVHICISSLMSLWHTPPPLLILYHNLWISAALNFEYVL